MRLALICPSNRLYMPYVKNYETILIEQKIEYDIVNWDRFQIEAIDENTYRDRKTGHQRGYLDYLAYKNFIVKRLKKQNYDKIIVFGIQLAYMLKNLLEKEYTREYVLDIRDYHILSRFFRLMNIIEKSSFVVLSSPGFIEWLPPSDQYVINHNIQIDNIEEMKITENNWDKERITIANIGATRDLSVQRDFIYSLQNNDNFRLNYHGEGDGNQELLAFIENNKINNVLLTGRYYPEEEAQLYKESDLINVLRYNDGINNKTALPNRLYNAMMYGKPLLAYKETYLAEIISSNDMGMVLHSFEDIEKDILHFINQFNPSTYDNGRKKYMEKVIQENKHFEESVRLFIKCCNS